MRDTSTIDAPRKSRFVRGPETLVNEDGRIYDGWKVTFASMMGLMFGQSACTIFVFGVFIPYLEKAFGWGIGAISLGATLISITLMVASVLAGIIVDRISIRSLVLWSLPLFGAAVAAMSLMTSSILTFYALLVVSVLLGLGLSPVVYNKATSVWFDRRLGFSLGIANTGIGLGAALLPMVVGVIAPAWGWRTAYLVLGIVAVVVPWPTAWFFLRERKFTSSSSAALHAATSTGLSFAQTRRTAQFWLLLGGFSVLGIASVALTIHMVRILVDTGISPAQAATLQSLLGVSLIAGRIATGWIVDRMHVGAVMVMLCLIAASALALLGAGAPFDTAALCAILGGIVIGAEFDVLGYIIARYFGRRAFGAIYAPVFAVFQVTGAVAVGLLGWWRATHGSYALGLYLIAGLLVLGAGCFAKLGPYRFSPDNAPA